MGICVNCVHKGTCTLVSYYEAQGEHVVKCGKRKPITHADRIRAMSDEELAKKMSGLESFALTCGGGWPPEKWLEWLRQEADG